ncbi:copper-containing nitrite reductase [Azospirillum sp. sgz302134]
MTGRKRLLGTAALVFGALVSFASIAPASANNGAPVDIVRNPTDLPAPLAKRAPQHIKVNLESVEVTGQLATGTSYRYWTFTEPGKAPKVPGPFVRVRVGDTVDVTMSNAADSALNHNVDFHAVTGPGGGGEATMAAPGEHKGFTFKALNPGLYVYHCATPLVAQHISNGMYGLILVEPEEGLPKVDREFYVMQGEIYTEQPFGTKGEATESYDKLLAEQPEYYVFNGAADALMGDKAPKAKVGETVRVFFGVGGPNKTSSFHVIGEIFDRVYDQASLTAKPLTNVQTTAVPAGGATMVEFKVEVPGKYVLVDHSLSRAARGLKGILQVDGPGDTAIFKVNPETKQVTELPNK